MELAVIKVVVTPMMALQVPLLHSVLVVLQDVLTLVVVLLVASVALVLAAAAVVVLIPVPSDLVELVVLVVMLLQ